MTILDGVPVDMSNQNFSIAGVVLQGDYFRDIKGASLRIKLLELPRRTGLAGE